MVISSFTAIFIRHELYCRVDSQINPTFFVSVVYYSEKSCNIYNIFIGIMLKIVVNTGHGMTLVDTLFKIEVR